MPIPVVHKVERSWEGHRVAQQTQCEGHNDADDPTEGQQIRVAGTLVLWRAWLQAEQQCCWGALGDVRWLADSDLANKGLAEAQRGHLASKSGHVVVRQSQNICAFSRCLPCELAWG